MPWRMPTIGKKLHSYIDKKDSIIKQKRTLHMGNFLWDGSFLLNAVHMCMYFDCKYLFQRVLVFS
jgi:hypothetical protein